MGVGLLESCVARKPSPLPLFVITAGESGTIALGNLGFTPFCKLRAVEKALAPHLQK